MDIFSDVLNDACVLSRMPIVWARFVVAWRISISSILISSCITSALNCDPLSRIMHVGR